MSGKKIAALGDSLTKGVILNERKRYSLVERNFIDLVREMKDIEIMNYGKFGCTVTYGHNVLDRHADEITASEYTLLEYGGNDCDFDWNAVGIDPKAAHSPKTSLGSFIDFFNGLIDRIRQLGSKPVIISLPPILSDLYYEFICKDMDAERKRNVLEWLGGDVNAISRWHESYNQALFKIAEQTSVPIIDITSPFYEYEDGIPSLICADGIHPNADGHALIADSINKFSF